MYYVYFLRSLRDSKYYIGCTSLTPNERLAVHNAGTVTSTKFRRPLVLIYFEQFENKSEAYKREFYLKSPRGYTDKRNILRAVSSVGRASH